MTNETYLVVSYFASGLLCLGLTLAAYVWLRRSVNGIASALPQENWGKVLKKAFPLSTILFAFSSFLAVDYYGGCGQKTYADIIKERSYLVEMNQKQVSNTLMAIVSAVLLWGLIVLLSLLVIQRARKAERPETPPPS